MAADKLHYMVQIRPRGVRLLPTPLADLPPPHTAPRICFIFCTGCDSTTFVVLIIQCQWYIGRKRWGLSGIWHREVIITYQRHLWLTAAPSRKKKEWSSEGGTSLFCTQQISQSGLRSIQRNRGRDFAVLAWLTVRVDCFCATAVKKKRKRKKKPCIMVDWLQ